MPVIRGHSKIIQGKLLVMTVPLEHMQITLVLGNVYHVPIASTAPVEVKRALFVMMVSI